MVPERTVKHSFAAALTRSVLMVYTEALLMDKKIRHKISRCAILSNYRTDSKTARFHFRMRDFGGS
jgi:hypothetical protein